MKCIINSIGNKIIKKITILTEKRRYKQEEVIIEVIKKRGLRPPRLGIKLKGCQRLSSRILIIINKTNFCRITP